MVSKVKEIIFVGTGPSSSLPNVTCLVHPTSQCKVCFSTLSPEGKKNRRNNTSLLIRLENSKGELKNVLIDCGKTFYGASLEWFYGYGITKIDAVILTHGHADAMMGLDDLRPWSYLATNGSIPIYLNQQTMTVIEGVFPYLVDTSKATGGGEVSSLSFEIIDSQIPFTVEGLDFLPLEVEHGFQGPNIPFMSLGFRFSDISYISDVSRIPDDTKHKMVGSRFFIIDCLRTAPYSSHFGLNQALEEVRRLRPLRTYLVGLSHGFDHTELEFQLAPLQSEEGLLVAPAYDGLRLAYAPDRDLVEVPLPPL